ncbi:MAG: flagellar protein export ATPase FliI [Motiliproteus sp.]|nr:flagellar protein export ATPase FliI [Motiliproteus sp.]MCW9052013.1 flagellar protein export ATPase FliI [Motiliproteus sp.]
MQTILDRLQVYRQAELKPPRPVVKGRVTRLVGLTLEAKGCRAAVGEYCRVEVDENHSADAEVVGFGQDSLFLMPLTRIEGLHPGAKVIPLGGGTKVPVGYNLLGRVLNGTGMPLDGKGPLEAEEQVSLEGPVINPLARQPIHDTLDVGIRAINSVLTVGRGQRLGLFAGSGVGKSVLLGMMTRFTEAEIIVVGLIGERGREVKEFIEQSLGEAGLSRAVVVASPADEAPLMRLRASELASRIAEYFRDQGKNVLLLMDSLTRFAQAQREIALAVGEPPATKGYPPSVFAKLPKLVERAGNGAEGSGSITAFYTVLTEGDDQQDPIADAARAILDGHVVLSRQLAEEGHYPAIDIEASISRAMPQIVTPEHLVKSQKFKQIYSRYLQNRDLISVGAYVKGSDAEIDLAIERMPHFRQFLQQGLDQQFNFTESWQGLHMVLESPPAAPQNGKAPGNQMTLRSAPKR